MSLAEHRHFNVGKEEVEIIGSRVTDIPNNHVSGRESNYIFIELLGIYGREYFEALIVKNANSTATIKFFPEKLNSASAEKAFLSSPLVKSYLQLDFTGAVVMEDKKAANEYVLGVYNSTKNFFKAYSPDNNELLTFKNIKLFSMFNPSVENELNIITATGHCNDDQYGAIAMFESEKIYKHNLISQRTSKYDQTIINTYLVRIANRIKNGFKVALQTLPLDCSLDKHYLNLYIQEVRPQSFHDVELNVDYKERELVKRLGAFWDIVIKKWVVSSANPDFALFEAWLPKADIVLHFTYAERSTARKIGAYFDAVSKNWKLNSFRVDKSIYEKWLPENNPRINLNVPSNRKSEAHYILRLNWDAKYKSFFTYPSNPDFHLCEKWICTKPLVEPVKPVNPLINVSEPVKPIVTPVERVLQKKSVINAVVREDQKLNTHVKDVREVSQLGAKYCPNQRTWFVPDDHPEPELFHKWLQNNNPRMYIKIPKGNKVLISKNHIEYDCEKQAHYIFKTHPKYKVFRMWIFNPE